MNFYTLWLRRILFSPQTLFQFSSLFSLLSLVLAVASLTVALLAINGFSSGLETILIHKHGHILVQSEKPVFKEELLEELSFYRDQVERDLFFFSFEALLVKDHAFKGVFFEAIEDEKIKQLSFLKTGLRAGSLDFSSDGQEQPSVLIGSELAKMLNLSVGSRLSAVIMGLEDPLVSRKRADFQVKAILNFGRHDFNSSFALIPLSSAQNLGFEKLSGVKLWLKEGSKSHSLSQTLALNLPRTYSVKSWRSADPLFFEIIQSDKKIIFFVLIILVIAAGFNISSSLFIQVSKRTKEINLLKAIGLETFHVKNLFLLGGLVLGLVGSFFGLLLGVFISWLLIVLQNKWSFIPAQTYQINEMVWTWSFSDLLLIFFISLLVIVLSSFLPARRAAQMNIKQALSYD